MRCFVVDYVLQTYETLRCMNVAVYDLEKERLYFLEVPNLSLNNSFFLVLYLFQSKQDFRSRKATSKMLLKQSLLDSWEE